MSRHMMLPAGPPRTFALVLADGESVLAELERFAADREIGVAAFSAIGALRRAVLGFFDPDAKKYVEISVCEQAEVLSLTGNVGRGDDGAVVLHAHAVLGRRNGSTCGGRLLSATVRPTLEIMVAESPGNLRRHYCDDVGLALIDLSSSNGDSDEGIVDSHPLRHGLAP